MYLYVGTWHFLQNSDWTIYHHAALVAQSVILPPDRKEYAAQVFIFYITGGGCV